MTTIKILIADDHNIVAESLSILIDTMDGMEVLGTASNGWQVLTFLENNAVDLVMIDLHMPLLNGIETTIKIREKYPKVKVLMLTMSEDATLIKDALQAGVNGYVMKRAEKAELAKAINLVASGQRYFSDAVVFKLAEMPNPKTTTGKDSPEENVPLTSREVEILRMIVAEMTNTDIAKKLYIAPKTVETHRRNLMKKVGVTSALGLLKYAMKHHLIEN